MVIEINKRVKKTKKIFFVIFILLLLGVIAGACYQNFILYNKTVYLEHSLLNLNNSILNTNSAQLVLQQKINSLESTIDSSNNSNEDLEFIQINQFINMANQSLVVYNDIPSGIKLLEYVNKVLLDYTEPEYLPLKVSVTGSIAKLSQLQYSDSIILTKQIDVILNQLTALPLATDKTEQTIPNNASSIIVQANIDNQSFYKKICNVFKTYFYTLVKVSSTDKNDAIKLLPEKEIIVSSNVKLDLLNARIAVLEHNQTLWKFSLTNVKNSINNFFMKNTITTSILSNLDGLLKANVSNKDVNIDDVLLALDKLNQFQHKKQGY